jgi:hypothetical protein
MWRFHLSEHKRHAAGRAASAPCPCSGTRAKNAVVHSTATACAATNAAVHSTASAATTGKATGAIVYTARATSATTGSAQATALCAANSAGTSESADTNGHICPCGTKAGNAQTAAAAPAGPVVRATCAPAAGHI